MQNIKQLMPSGNVASSELVDMVVAALREHLDADVVFLSEFRDELKLIRKVAGNGEPISLREGASFPLNDTYCYRVAQGQLPNIIHDARHDERVMDLPITEQLRISSYISVPVRLSDEQLFGTLCGLFLHTDTSLHERDVQFMHVLADIIGEQLSRESVVVEDRRLKTRRIRSILEQEDMHMVFQPIVNIRTREIVGAEALARFDAEPRRTPDVWFAEAGEVGLGSELEIKAVQLALAQMEDIPESIYLSVNVSPDTLQSEAFFELLAKVDATRLVIEVTEHAIVKDYATLISAIGRVNETGARLAVDDVGAGYSGLGHIVRITPRIMKLDISLTRDIYHDTIKQALGSSAVAFASRINMGIVAEGVETAEDALALQLLGVHHAQGYQFARPGPLPLAVEPAASGRNIRDKRTS